MSPCACALSEGGAGNPGTRPVGFAYAREAQEADEDLSPWRWPATRPEASAGACLRIGLAAASEPASGRGRYPAMTYRMSEADQILHAQPDRRMHRRSQGRRPRIADSPCPAAMSLQGRDIACVEPMRGVVRIQGVKRLWLLFADAPYSLSKTSKDSASRRVRPRRFHELLTTQNAQQQTMPARNRFPA